MQQPAQNIGRDAELLGRFSEEIGEKVPHWDYSSGTPKIVNPTPLVDVTGALIDCARTELGLELSSEQTKVLAKMDSGIFGGSVKVRPAVQIIEDALATGKLKSGQVVFEATSGNFGLALGLLRELDISVVALVSRKVQEGVVKKLNESGVKTIDLDVDICPVPGVQVEQNAPLAKAVASNVRQQLGQLGFDLSTLDASRDGVEGLLAHQDVIGLAKLLAKIYEGFCPEQYDNELNMKAHQLVTGPEIDQQLSDLGGSLADYRVVTTFGTGGTSTGLSSYISAKHSRRNVHVIFPKENQDVAGIRAKTKARGLRMYRPELYAGEHEVDFEQAKLVLRYFNEKGYDVGESSALALYATVQLLNFGVGRKFLVLVADGALKYSEAEPSRRPRSHEVSLEEAVSNIKEYAGVVWAHGMFVPRKEGISLLASSLGCDESRVEVASAKDIQTLLATQQLPDRLRQILPQHGAKLLLVCMAGGTSLRVAQILEKSGVNAVSLTGGLSGLSQAKGGQPLTIIQLAEE